MLSYVWRQCSQQMTSGAIVSARNVCRRFYSYNQPLLDELTARGLTSEVTRPTQLSQHLEKQSRVVYLGVDPTANALHVGHLVPFMCLLHFYLRGHKILPVVGGGTGQVGDPSGKDTERNPITRQSVVYNSERLHNNILRFFKSASSYADSRLGFANSKRIPPEIIDNAIWLESERLINFLATVGKRVRVNAMLQRESVQRRLTSKQGISFTEFTYQLLQAYDFYFLRKHMNCSVQIGGADQYGNIVAGLDLIRAMAHSSHEDNTPNLLDSSAQGPVYRESADNVGVYGLTTPLLTTASGAKFGKSEGNAVWLDAKNTSVFDFYQHFVRTADEDVCQHLKLFTLLPLSHIEAHMAKHKDHPENRLAQNLLANELTELVHGVEGVRRALKATNLLFRRTNFTDVKAEDFLDAFEGDSRLSFCEADEVIGVPLPKLLTNVGFLPSKGEVHRLLSSGGLYLNGIQLTTNDTVSDGKLLDSRVAVFRAGKERHKIIALRKS